MASDAEKQQIRDATDLVQLIGDDVPLTQKGREHIGLCPFHEDHNPSLHVVTHREQAFYKCFACGATGDAFRFMMDYHRMTFPESLHFLADRAGITLEQTAWDRDQDAEQGPGREELLRANQYALEYFRSSLLADSRESNAARAQLRARNISGEMAESFQVGYAPPGYEGFLATLKGREESIETACVAGLLRRRENGDGVYDTFRDRLIFPICDGFGKPIAFGGRVLDDADQPKYLNSPESPVFSKSRTLYGLHRLREQGVRETIQKQGVIIVVEGYTDVIACVQAGICNVVGTLGTALTSQHADILSRFADRVILVFDGDEAGVRAADRALQVFFTRTIDIGICILPDGKDPAEILSGEHGSTVLQESIDSAMDAMAFKFHRFQEGFKDATGMTSRQKAIEQFIADLVDLGIGSLDGVRKDMVLRTLATLVDLPLSTIEKVADGLILKQAPRPATEDSLTGENDSREDASSIPSLSRARGIAERALLSVILFDPSCLRVDSTPGTYHLDAEELQDPLCRKVLGIMTCLLEQEESHMPTMQEILDSLEDRQAGSVISTLYFEGQRACADTRDRTDDVLAEHLATFRTCCVSEKHAHDVATFHLEDSTDDSTTLLEQVEKRRLQGNVPGAIGRGVRTR